METILIKKEMVIAPKIGKKIIGMLSDEEIGSIHSWRISTIRRSGFRVLRIDSRLGAAI